MFATAASARRGQLELVRLETGQRRATALTYARTNATKAIGALAKVLHGSATTNFGVELPGLSKTPSAATDQLLSVLMYDSCIVLPESGTIRDHCDSLHAEYGLRGLLSFTTAMLDDSVQMRDAFDEANATDMRTQAELGGLERDRSALYSVMLSLPEDVILDPAVTEAVIDSGGADGPEPGGQGAGEPGQVSA
ncbi:hypothetical protein FNF28_07790 [Cafeteria roenbergensis]|uniref:Uncharacterized protein n=1 Tax=Cafeteria roenbergensis TaxID=33653 RepID=A0A5A8BZV4_CAFRO|nr:hypothetical protein FNF28_07790 [Cafeteria roenbergensis]